MSQTQAFRFTSLSAMKFSLYVLFVATGLTPVLTYYGCPDKYSLHLTFFGNCYGFAFDKGDKKTYNQARKTCQEEGGMLALPKINYINRVLASTVLGGIGNRAWIGLNDIKDEMKFVWEDGTNLSPENSFDAFVSENEGSNNPARIAKDWEDCVALDHDQTWHDYRCNFEKKFYICQFRIKSV